MILESIATAVPSYRYSQRECYSALQTSTIYQSLNSQSRALLKHILNNGKSGIEHRHFAAESIAHIVDRSAQQLNETFETEAADLGSTALLAALDKAGIDPQALDALFICTCTGYICPGLSSHVAERLNFRGDVFLSDVVGLGCGAAIPTLRSAASFLALNPNARVAMVAVEICSAAFYASDDPGVLISLCLFGDGAAAAVFGNGKTGTDAWNVGHFASIHMPEHRESIRFVNAEGKLRNQLDKCVPAIAAESVAILFAKRKGEPDRILAHSGGRDVVDALEAALETELSETRAVLAEYGNMSSPSLLFALEKALATAAAGGDVRFWLTSFGAGFSAHACEMWRHS